MRAKYRSITTTLSGLIVFFALTFCLFAQAIVVCPECAYEVTAEARFCAHCGARIEQAVAPTTAPAQLDTPPSSPQTAITASTTSPASSSADPATLVKEDIASGARFMTEGNTPNPAAALAALMNARAIMTVATPDTIDQDTRSTILKGIIATRTAVSKVRADCPRCHGKGHEDVIQNFATLNGSRTPLVAGKRTCPMCAGRGTIIRLRKISEIKSLLGSGKQLAANEALISGRIKIGNAWASPALAAELTLKQQAMLRHYTADPCPECVGYGKTDCKTCDNTGFATCTAEGCVNGFIQPPPAPRANPRQKSIESMRIAAPRICPACKGTALTTCHQCAGTGSINCRRCNGSGDRNTCTRCKGDGIQPCKTCRGTGKDRQGDDCVTCSGEGNALCTSCGGDGYGR